MSMRSLPRIAVIGCGNFARRQHLPNLAHWGDGVLHAVCDADPELAESSARRFGASYATASLDKILHDPDIGAVVIAVRDTLQAGIALRAIEAGKHAYVEKPGAQTVADFDRLIAAREKAGVRVAVGFNKRFAPAYREAMRLITRRGDTRCLYLRMADDAWRWAADYPPGSLLRHDLCHFFDLAPWLTGSPVARVYAVSSRPDEDLVVLTHANGAVSALFNSGHATMDFPKERMEAVCQRGSVTVDDYVEVNGFGGPDGAERLTFPGLATDPVDQPWVDALGKRGLDGMLEVRRGIRKLWGESGAATPPALPNFLRDQGWRESIRTFAACLAEGVSLPHAGLEQARISAIITDAALRSRDSGQPVEIGGMPVPAQP
jgi:predicted dehydrogenase